MNKKKPFRFTDKMRINMQLHSNRLEAPRNVTVHGNGKFKMKYISINLQNRPSYFAVNKKKLQN